MKTNYRYPPLVITLFIIAVLLSILFAVHLASADEPATPEPLPNVREVLARPDTGRVIILVASDAAAPLSPRPGFLFPL